MRTLALTDYVERIREIVAVVRIAKTAKEAVLASSLAKGAVVMTAAALERYINDALRAACSSVKATRWEDLVPGQRRYLLRQFGIRMQRTSEPLLGTQKPLEKLEEKLRQFLGTCSSAFQNPSTWTGSVELGMFLEGQAAPEQVEKVLAQFDGTERGLYGLLEDRGWDRAAIVRALSQLVEARHGVAHALPGAPSVSPEDARSWLVASCRLAVHIDDFLAHAPTGRFPPSRVGAHTGGDAPSISALATDPQ